MASFPDFVNENEIGEYRKLLICGIRVIRLFVVFFDGFWPWSVGRMGEGTC